MDGQSPNKKTATSNHGLRLIKGSSVNSDGNSASNSVLSSSEKPQNPLVKQLSSLADAIDADVKRLLNL